jgi:hypothetical protein
MMTSYIARGKKHRNSHLVGGMSLEQSYSVVHLIEAPVECDVYSKLIGGTVLPITIGSATRFGNFIGKDVRI